MLIDFRKELKLTCIMYQMDQVMQLETVRSEPKNQFSCVTPFPWIWIRGFHKFLTRGPLYNVITVTPPNDNMVPNTFAIPLEFRISRASNLHYTQPFN